MTWLSLSVLCYRTVLTRQFETMKNMLMFMNLFFRFGMLKRHSIIVSMVMVCSLLTLG